MPFYRLLTLLSLFQL